MKFIILFLLFIRPLFAMEILSPPGDKVEVKIFVYMKDVMEINDAKKEAKVNFFLISKWKDHRWKKRFKRKVKIPADEIWNPEIQIVNERDLVEIMGKTVQGYPNGEIKYIQRFSGIINMDTDLKNYPFDGQTIHLTLISPDNEVSFTDDENQSSMSEKFTIEGWEFSEVKITTKRIFYGKNKDLTKNTFIFEMEGKRLPGYFLWHLIIPMALFLFLGAGVFYISPKELNARVTISFTIILTLLAHGFMFLGKTPDLHFLTKLDVFFAGSLLMTLFIFASTIVTYEIAEEDLKKGKRVSRILGQVYLGLLGLLLVFILV